MEHLDEELDALAGDSIAVLVIITGLCRTLMKRGMRDVVEEAFAYAETAFETGSLAIGTPDNAGHLQQAAFTTETLRKAVLGDPTKPKGGV
jgi:hypothetical protein